MSVVRVELGGLVSVFCNITKKEYGSYIISPDLDEYDNLISNKIKLVPLLGIIKEEYNEPVTVKFTEQK